jgi:hypothetical protein
MSKYTIKDMKKVAVSKKGKCLSYDYLGMNEHLKWECACGNTFKATPSKIIHRNQWCPKCGIKKSARSQASNINECKYIASERGGKCLSKIYNNNSTLLKWQCKEGHHWHATLRSVKDSQNRKGTWCPECSGNLPHDIEYAHSVARELGWKCLSTKYVNYNGKLDWQCPEGHNFSQSLAKVVYRRSCPKCHIYYGEELCRFYFESIFKDKFPKIKPDFLKIGKGINWELDGYNEKLGLAFEHHGEQHYKFNSKFHKSDRDFKQRQSDDIKKKKLCRKHEVTLIEIPAIPELTSIISLGPKIIAELGKHGIKFNLNNIPKSLDFKYISKNSRIDLLREIARERGGTLLSKIYHSGRVNLKWKCEKGHSWDAMPENIIGNKAKKGTWCPHCANEERNNWKKPTLLDMQKIAKQKGGLCLSIAYIDSVSKLDWQCKKGHTWKAVPNSIRQGHWCPYCSGNIVTLESLQKWAKEFKGKCLSSSYKNNTQLIKWSCKNGHVWAMATGKMQRRLKESKVWCIECKKL